MTPEVLAKISLPLAISAYSPCKPPDLPLSMVLKGEANPIIKAISGDKMAWGYVTRAEKSMYIPLRGTETLPEWIGDLNAVGLHWWRGAGRIHAGAMQLYSALAPSLKEAMGNLYGVDEIYIPCHSLGAMVGTLHAVEMAYFYPSLKVYLCTFGSPRVGDMEFAATVRSMSNLQVVRIANRHDLFTQLPLHMPGAWSHVGMADVFDIGFHLEKRAHSLELTYKPEVEAMTANTKFEWIV